MVCYYYKDGSNGGYCYNIGGQERWEDDCTTRPDIENFRPFWLLGILMPSGSSVCYKNCTVLLYPNVDDMGWTGVHGEVSQ